VPHLRGHRERDRFFVEPFGARRTADTPAVFLARVPRDSLSAIGRAAGKQLSDAVGEAHDEIGVDFGATFRVTLAAPRPYFGIFQALCLGPFERLLFDQKSLTLVPLTRATPFEYDGHQR
jgi:hypothetical protein